MRPRTRNAALREEDEHQPTPEDQDSNSEINDTVVNPTGGGNEAGVEDESRPSTRSTTPEIGGAAALAPPPRTGTTTPTLTTAAGANNPTNAPSNRRDSDQMARTQASSPYLTSEIGRLPNNQDVFVPGIHSTGARHRTGTQAYDDLFTEVAQLRLQIEALVAASLPKRTTTAADGRNEMQNQLLDAPEESEIQGNTDRRAYQGVEVTFEDFIKEDPILDLKAVMKTEFAKCKMKMGKDAPESERRKWEIMCYRVFIGDWADNKLARIFNETKLKRGRKSQNKIISDLHFETHKLCQIIDDWLERIYGAKELTIPNPLRDALADQENYIYNFDLLIHSSNDLLKDVQRKDLPGSVISEKQSKKVPKDQRRLLDTIDRKNRDFEASRKKNQKEEKTSNLTRPRLENNLLRNREEDFGLSSSEDDDSDSLEDARNARSGSEEEEEVEPLGEERREDLNFLLNATSASKKGFNYFDDPDAERVNRNALRNKREYKPLISRGKALEPINPFPKDNPFNLQRKELSKKEKQNYMKYYPAKEHTLERKIEAIVQEKLKASRPSTFSQRNRGDFEEKGETSGQKRINAIAETCKSLKPEFHEEFLREFEQALKPEDWNDLEEMAFYKRLPQPFNIIPAFEYNSNHNQKTLWDYTKYELKEKTPEAFQKWIIDFNQHVNNFRAPAAEKITALQRATASIHPGIVKAGPPTICLYQHMLVELMSTYAHPTVIGEYMSDMFREIGLPAENMEKWDKLEKTLALLKNMVSSNYREGALNEHLSCYQIVDAWGYIHRNAVEALITNGELNIVNIEIIETYVCSKLHNLRSKSRLQRNQPKERPVTKKRSNYTARINNISTAETAEEVETILNLQAEEVEEENEFIEAEDEVSINYISDLIQQGESVKIRCPFKCTDKHGIQKCAKFKKLSVKEKRNWLYRNRRCLSCYDPGHQMSKCPKGTECKAPVAGNPGGVCGLKHAAELHMDFDKGTPQESINHGNLIDLEENSTASSSSILPVTSVEVSRS